jgi:putative ATPase
MSNIVLLTYDGPAACTIEVVRGDITAEGVDAIVNAANGRLAHGGGVAGAIVRAGGREIQEESRAWVREHGEVPTGEAAITGAGTLPARYVIHAVGPVWRDRGDEPQLLRDAVQSALALADERGVSSLSLPAISSGIFGFPKPRAAEVIWQATLDYLEAHPATALTRVRFCNIDRTTAQIFRKEGERRRAV